MKFKSGRSRSPCGVSLVTFTVLRFKSLAGPGVYTLRELISFALRLIDKRLLLVPVPFAVAEIQARLFELLPSPLTTS